MGSQCADTPQLYTTNECNVSLFISDGKIKLSIKLLKLVNENQEKI